MTRSLISRTYSNRQNIFPFRGQTSHAEVLSRTQSEAAVPRVRVRLNYASFEENRLIISADWPIIHWDVELSLVDLKFNVMVIREAQKTADTERASVAFIDPAHPVLRKDTN